MSFPRYPTYKDSGVEWLGQVPDHWAASKLRWISRRYSGGTPNKEVPEYWQEGTVPWLNSGAVNDWLITEPSAYISERALTNSSAKWIPAGSLLMALAGQGKTKGMTAQLAFPSTCNQSMAAIIPSDEIEPRFLLWWLNANYQNIRNMAGGDLRDGLNLELLGNIPCPLPPHDDQRRIAAFLDHETAKIDTLIAEQQRLIELLNEKRQAVISHAVTKGLNPNAPMKPSGVEWLGDVPKHWVVGGLPRFIGPVVDYRGRTPEKLDSGMFLVTARNIRNGKIDYEASEEYVSPASAESLLARGRPEIGDLLFTMEAPLGSVAQIDRSDIALAQRVVKFRGRPGMLENKFLMYYIMGSFIQARLSTLATGSTALGIKASKLSMIECVCPPVGEQLEICAFIDKEISRSESLLAYSKSAIDLLQERRSALISAAVTGQIDVRGFASQVAA